MSEDSQQDESAIDTSPENLLQESQKIRKQLVDEIVSGGIPTDKDGRRILLQTLAEMDQTSIQRVRNDIGQQSVDNDRQAQQIVEQIYRNSPQGLRATHPVDRALPDCHLPDYEAVEGETYVGVANESSQDFLNRMDGEQNST